MDKIIKSKFDVNFFEVYNSKGEKTFIVAKAFAETEHTDIAFLNGNFEDFNQISLDVDNFTMKPGDDVFACGYPGGFDLVCTAGSFKGTASFNGKMSAYLAKGMSGGPVFNKFGKAIGVNSSNQLDGLCYFGILFGNIKVEK